LVYSPDIWRKINIREAVAFEENEAEGAYSGPISVMSSKDAMAV
jgi:hypothetical protein